MARPRKREATELSTFLDRLIKRAGMSHNAFSTAIGCAASWLSDRKLRYDHQADRDDEDLADRAAKVLGLRGEERDELFRLLQESRAPRSVRDRLALLERQVRRAAEGPPKRPQDDRTRP